MDMPPKRSQPQPRSYGRQASGRTIKSLSIQDDVVVWAEEQAKRSGLTFSAWIERELRAAQRKMTVNEEQPPADAQPLPPSHQVSYQPKRTKKR